MMYDRECLYDVQWQQIRVSMLGTWTSVENVRKNIRTLMQYVEDSSLGREFGERGIRTSNYMAAILLGYGNKPEWNQQRDLVKLAHKYFAQFASRPRSSLVWNWRKVEQDLHTADYQFIQACIQDLKKRIATSTKRTGGTQNRPELMKFWELLTRESLNRQQGR